MVKSANKKPNQASVPEYLVQRQLEQKFNRSYSKLLLALHVNILAELNNQISEPEKTK